MNKNGIIKFAWRRNLIYPIQLLIWALLRKIDTIILDKLFNFSKNLLFTFLMFFAEFIAGIILFLYQRSFLEKKKTKEKSKSNLIFKENKIKSPDSIIKILFLIFVAGYSDFVEFILSTNYLPKFPDSSGSLDIRLGGILTIFVALFFYYLLKFPLFRHQIFAIMIIGICLIIIITSEYFFQDINIFISYGDFTLKLMIIIIEQFFHSLLDSIEKYVVEYDSLNYFEVLAFEGLFGVIITLIYSFSEDFYQKQLIKDISKIYSENTKGMFYFFIFMILIYTVLCGGKNAFRVVTNKVYSPMTKSLTDYFWNPLFLIINYFEGDFVSGGKQNLFYFLMNLILSIIIDLSGCVFNEIVILYFCDLDKDTHRQVSIRSSLNYSPELSQLIARRDDSQEVLSEDLNSNETDLSSLND